MYDDLHTARAAELFNCPQEQVTEQQRLFAKLVAYQENYSMDLVLRLDSLTKLDEKLEAASLSTPRRPANNKPWYQQAKHGNKYGNK